MDIPMLRNRPDLLEPGNYRVKVGNCYTMDSILGTEVVMRFDLLEEGLTDRSVDEWAEVVLTGGQRRSRLSSWISALVFDGKPLPEGYTLNTASLLFREALAGIALIDRDGLLFNRILCLYPLRVAVETEAGLANNLGDPESHDELPAQSCDGVAAAGDDLGAPAEEKQ